MGEWVEVGVGEIFLHTTEEREHACVESCLLRHLCQLVPNLGYGTDDCGSVSLGVARTSRLARQQQS